jgi:uncharacterized protein (TIGR00106 family)
MAIQVLPKSDTQHPYNIVDKAIEVIKKSGLNYIVCPFETVVEGNYQQLIQLAHDVQEACYNAGATELLTYLKIQTHKDKNVYLEDKIGKYK